MRSFKKLNHKINTRNPFLESNRVILSSDSRPRSARDGSWPIKCGLVYVCDLGVDLFQVVFLREYQVTAYDAQHGMDIQC
jgi:hypothetical protein